MPYRKYATDADRILRNVLHDSNGCWIWQLRTNRYGYGQLQIPPGRFVTAHRLAYEVFVDPVPEGLQLDHLCRVRECCNPAHLEPVTGRENRLRSPLNFIGRNAAKTHCASGHPFDEANTRINGKGHRICRACQRYRVRRQRACGVSVTPERAA